MHRVKCWQVDAFTDRPYRGNPAAVCWLENDAPDDWMQAVAGEMNLSETTFISRQDDGYSLRWFTPLVEVPLCGHATLASAHVLWTERFQPLDQPIHCHTKSGVLTCKWRDGLIEMDFPATPAYAVDPPVGLLESLGVNRVFVGKSQFDQLVVIEDAQQVRSLSPDFGRMKTVSTRGVMVTSRSDDSRYDFISRFFAPAVGIDEDPVTGSAHCCLGPYWAVELGKTALTAFQASTRGGTIVVTIEKERVYLGGRAVTVLRGELVSNPPGRAARRS